MKAIADVLSPYAAGNARLGDLLAISVGRVLLKDARRGSDWRSQVTEERLRHVADWLKAALVNNEAWLDNIDDKGRPKKLMKFGSLGQIVQEADKAMLRAAQQLSAVQLTKGDEELFAELEDGFRLVRLMTPAALDRESFEMQHCIGNGGYDEFLQDDASIYLSLRDKSGKAHATLEIDDGTIIQLQGKQNRPPIRTYLEKLIPYIRESGYAVDVSATHLGYVVDSHGDWHDIKSLPVGLTVRGGLNLRGSGISVLPERMTVTGDLNLSGTLLTALPKGLTVGGSLYMYDTNICLLSEGLTVGGSLDLFDTDITVLPEGLKVGRNLDIGKTEITELPEGLTVGENLYLYDLKIASLPDSLADETPIFRHGKMITARDFRQTNDNGLRLLMRQPRLTLS